jgi:hypothetical protein
MGLAESAADFDPMPPETVCCEVVPQHLESCALDQGAGDRVMLNAIHAG